MYQKRGKIVTLCLFFGIASVQRNNMSLLQKSERKSPSVFNSQSKCITGKRRKKTIGRSSLIFDNLIDVRGILIVLLICNPLVNILFKYFYWFIGNLGSFLVKFLFFPSLLLSILPFFLLMWTFSLDTNFNLLHVM